MLRFARFEVLGVFLLSSSLAIAGPDLVSSKKTDPATQDKATSLYARMPLAFEVNQGQTDSSVKALSRGSGYGLFLTADESVVVMTRDSGKSAVLRVKLLGAQTSSRVVPEEKLPGTVNSFIGNDRSKWHTAIATYAKMKYEGIYKGVDLVYYGNQQQLEYDFIVAPGSDPKTIRLGVSGAKVRIDSDGNLVLHTDLGDVVHHKPVIYQEIAGVRRDVAGRFIKRSGHEIGFVIGDYDREQSLVIDPTLGFSTYLGGNGADKALAVAVDAVGDTFVGGSTTSTNFPTNGTNPGPYPTYQGGSTDAFFSVIFFQGNGSQLFISTYFGGNGADSVNSIALLQGSGQLVPQVFVSGTTSSTNLPMVSPLQPTYGGGASDAFVAHLEFPNIIAYCSYLGGSGADTGNTLTSDSQGNVIIAGSTTSTDFPTTLPFQAVNEGGMDGFVTKFNSTFTSYLYSTYLGGSGNDTITSVADTKGDTLIIVGSTTSSAFGPPASTSTYSKAFLTSFNSTGQTQPMVTRIFGGQGVSVATGVAVFAGGNSNCAVVAPAALLVTGYTNSASGFPTRNAIQTVSAGGYDAFFQAYNAQGMLVLSTYYGGAGTDQAMSIAVDPCGNAWIGGLTNSTNFPTLNALQSTNGGGYDGFVVNFAPSVTGISSVGISTYLGGSGSDVINSVSVGSKGNPVVAGYTASPNFPTTTPVVQGTSGGGQDAFATKIVTH